MESAVTKEAKAMTDDQISSILRKGAILVSKDQLMALAVLSEAADRIEARKSTSNAAVLSGAKALHEDWIKVSEPVRSLMKPESIFPWDDLHPDNRKAYERSSRVVLDAAAKLSE